MRNKYNENEIVQRYKEGLNTKEIANRASLKFLNQIKSFLLEYNIESYIRNTKTCKVLTVQKQKDVLFLYDHLYYETDLFLERKRNNFGPLLKKFNRLYALNSGNHRQGILSETSLEGRAETIIGEPKE